MRLPVVSICVVCLGLSLFVTSCNPEDIDNPVEPKELSKRPFFSSFSFLKEYNASLSHDFKGDIIGDSLILINCYKVNEVVSLIPSFEGNYVSVDINGVNQSSGITPNNYTDSLTYHLTDSLGNEASYKVIVNAFNGVPRIDIHTEGAADIVSKDTYIGATLTISNNLKHGGNGTYACEIRGRGNATWNNHPKKPYKIKLKEKANLFRFHTDKDWVLLAEYCDKSLMRSAYIFGLSKIANLPYTVNLQYADLYLNDEYRGTYILTEQVEIEKYRVALESDGYLIEDDLYYDREPLYFTTSKCGYNYTFKYPKPDKGEIAKDDEKYTYINSFMNEFEEALYSDNFKDPDTGYRKYIDTQSFVRWFLATELPGNLEPNLFYYLEKRGDKLHLGPIWDAEWSLGLAARGGDFYGWYLYPYEAKYDIEIWGKNKYFTRLFEDPYFTSLLKQEWKEMKQRIDGFKAEMAVCRNYIEYTQEDNFIKWPILDEYVSVGLIALGSWEAEVDYIEKFFEKRLDWFDGYINALQ